MEKRKTKKYLRIQPNPKFTPLFIPSDSGNIFSCLVRRTILTQDLLEERRVVS